MDLRYAEVVCEGQLHILRLRADGAIWRLSHPDPVHRKVGAVPRCFEPDLSFAELWTYATYGTAEIWNAESWGYHRMAEQSGPLVRSNRDR